MSVPEIKLKENFRIQTVECFVDGTKVFSSREYKKVSEWLKNKYNLSSTELKEIQISYQAELFK